MKSVKTHTFHKRKYKIGVGPPLDGMCSQYKSERELNIMVSLRTRNGLITAVHEAMHALNWRAAETQIDQDSKELGIFLWRLGFRWVPEKL